MEKRRYYVCHSAEGETCGEIWLTEEEARLVAYATDPANWEGLSGDGWGGSFEILDADASDAYEKRLLEESGGFDPGIWDGSLRAQPGEINK